jgi:myo-inositol-1(or 4)-monophosphatase
VERLVAVQPSLTVLPHVRSLALRLARLAQGVCDLAVAGGNSHDWDLAAADLLVHEAGGVLTSVGDGAVIYNRPVARHGMLIAGGRYRHAMLIEVFRDQRLASS